MSAVDVFLMLATQTVEGVVELAGIAVTRPAQAPLSSDHGGPFGPGGVVRGPGGHQKRHGRRGHLLHGLAHDRQAVGHLLDS